MFSRFVSRKALEGRLAYPSISQVDGNLIAKNALAVERRAVLGTNLAPPALRVGTSRVRDGLLDSVGEVEEGVALGA